MEKEKVKLYLKYNEGVMNILRAIGFHAVTAIILVIMQGLVFGFGKGAGSYRLLNELIVIYTALIIYNIVKIVIKYNKSKNKIEELDNKYSFDKVKGYELDENKIKELKKGEVNYLLGVNNLSKERMKDLKIRVEMNRGELTDSELELAVGMLKDFDKNLKEIRSFGDKSLELSYLMSEEGRMVDMERFLESLVREPERIIEVPDVINKYVPYLKEMVKKYSKVDEQKINDEYGERVKRDAKHTIKNLLQIIITEYEKYKKKELGDLKKSLKSIEQMRKEEEARLESKGEY